MLLAPIPWPAAWCWMDHRHWRWNTMKTMWFFLVPEKNQSNENRWIMVKLQIVTVYGSWIQWNVRSSSTVGYRMGTQHYTTNNLFQCGGSSQNDSDPIKASSHQPVFKSGKWTCPVSDKKSCVQKNDHGTCDDYDDYHRTHILRNTWWIVLRYHHKFHCGNWPSPTNIDPEKPKLEGSNLPILMNRSVYVSWRKGKIIQLVLMFVLIKSW